jgi:hypothetical protein
VVVELAKERMIARQLSTLVEAGTLRAVARLSQGWPADAEVVGNGRIRLSVRRDAQSSQLTVEYLAN